jgi:hypothetical protein
MICNCIFSSPPDRFFGGTGWDRWYSTVFNASRWYWRVGPVGPAFPGLARCPSGPAVFHGGPTSPSHESHPKSRKLPQYHRYHRSPRGHDGALARMKNAFR